MIYSHSFKKVLLCIRLVTNVFHNQMARYKIPSILFSLICYGGTHICGKNQPPVIKGIVAFRNVSVEIGTILDCKTLSLLANSLNRNMYKKKMSCFK